MASDNCEETIKRYSKNKKIQLGICCINTKLREMKPPIFCSRKMQIKSIEKKGIDELKKKIILNLKDVIKMMHWNERNGIKVFRLSSELFPHKSNPRVERYTFEFALPLLKKIGQLSRIYNQRLTFHPGQYNVVGTPHVDAFIKTCNDLEYHANVLDLMNAGADSVMVVHGGGVYGDKQATLDRWCENFYKLPDNVQKRLVLENCERCFSIEDCLYVSNKIGIPVVFDTHHYECYKILHPEEKIKEPSEYIQEILQSWVNRGIKPKFHVSEQGSGRVGHHSDFIKHIPDYLMEIPEKYGINIDIMIEAKKKEQAIMYLYKRYPELNCKIELIINE